MFGIRRVSIFLAAVLLGACSDDAPTNNNVAVTFKNESSATVNGRQWAATNVTATRNDAGGLVIITFVAHGPNGSHIDFGLTNASKSTFTIDGAAVQAGFAIDGKSFGDNHNATGTISVSDLAGTGIKGTFNISAMTSTGESGTAVGSFEAAF